MILYELTEADTQLAELVRLAESGESVTFTRQGKPVAVLMSIAEYERLGGEKKKNFWEAIQEMRSAPDFEPVDLTDEEIASWRDRSPARDFSWDE
ncbi:type II toxin-antitoxin system Phd/YefM family antitoxin [Methylomagnum sp.]